MKSDEMEPLPLEELMVVHWPSIEEASQVLHQTRELAGETVVGDMEAHETTFGFNCLLHLVSPGAYERKVPKSDVPIWSCDYTARLI